MPATRERVQQDEKMSSGNEQATAGVQEQAEPPKKGKGKQKAKDETQSEVIVITSEDEVIMVQSAVGKGLKPAKPPAKTKARPKPKSARFVPTTDDELDVVQILLATNKETHDESPRPNLMKVKVEVQHRDVLAIFLSLTQHQQRVQAEKKPWRIGLPTNLPSQKQLFEFANKGLGEQARRHYALAEVQREIERLEDELRETIAQLESAKQWLKEAQADSGTWGDDSE